MTQSTPLTITSEMEKEFWRKRYEILSDNHEAVCQMLQRRDEVLRRIAPQYYGESGLFEAYERNP